MRPSDSRTVTITINGKPYTAAVEHRLLLSDFIRHTAGLTGTHVGCEHGVCGACTVLWHEPESAGAAVRSCLLLAVQADGASLSTVEGLTDGDVLHPLQLAFMDEHALQCGFCTPGLLMTLIPFLQENPRPTEAEIRSGISGNLCRCTGYQNIVRAVQKAALLMADRSEAALASEGDGP